MNDSDEHDAWMDADLAEQLLDGEAVSGADDRATDVARLLAAAARPGAGEPRMDPSLLAAFRANRARPEKALVDPQITSGQGGTVRRRCDVGADRCRHRGAERDGGSLLPPGRRPRAGAVVFLPSGYPDRSAGASFPRSSPHHGRVTALHAHPARPSHSPPRSGPRTSTSCARCISRSPAGPGPWTPPPWPAWSRRPAARTRSPPTALVRPAQPAAIRTPRHPAVTEPRGRRRPLPGGPPLHPQPPSLAPRPADRPGRPPRAQLTLPRMRTLWVPAGCWFGLPPGLLSRNHSSGRSRPGSMSGCSRSSRRSAPVVSPPAAPLPHHLNDARFSP